MTENQPQISMIAAMGKDRTIGKNGEIPWYIPDDFKYFKSKTLGKPIIMGRTTFESIHALKGTKPTDGPCLPKRPHIIVTRQKDYKIPGCTIAHSITDALNQAATMTDDEIMICGGANIYEQCLPFANTIYLTVIDENYDGDAFFPELSNDAWELTSSENKEGYAFNVYNHLTP